jgi:hypothetical protein
MAAPKPSELANHAKPRPAAKPPSIAPHGFLGATGAAAGVAAVGLAAEFVAFCAGAAGAFVALFCVTLLDCLPNEPPPPIRRAASAFKPEKANAHTKIADHNFILTPKISNKTINYNYRFKLNIGVKALTIKYRTRSIKQNRLLPRY